MSLTKSMAKQILYDVMILTLFSLLAASDIPAASTELSNPLKIGYETSECQRFYVHGKEVIFYQGKVVIPYVERERETHIVLEFTQDDEADFTKSKAMCVIKISHSCKLDEPNDGIRCNCGSFENLSSYIKITLSMNITADKMYSNGHARLHWKNLHDKKDYFSNIVWVPRIENDFKEEFTLDEDYISLSQCHLSVHENSTLKYCVTGLSTHTLKISAGYWNLAEGQDCVQYTFNKGTSALAGFRVSFVEHSRCERERSHRCSMSKSQTRIPAASTEISNYAKENTSECKTGLVHGRDRIIYQGRVFKPYTDEEQETHIILEMAQYNDANFTRYKAICVIKVTWYCEWDELDDGFFCDCPFYEGTDLYANLTLFWRITADMMYSNGYARVHWKHLRNRKDYFSNIVKVPAIEENDFKEEFTLDETRVSLSPCILLVHEASTVKWCVSGIRSHTLKISSGSKMLAGGNDCVTFTFNKDTISLSSFTVSFVEHINCERKRSYDCELKKARGALMAATSRAQSSFSGVHDALLSRDAIGLRRWMLFAIIGHLFI